MTKLDLVELTHKFGNDSVVANSVLLVDTPDGILEKRASQLVVGDKVLRRYDYIPISREAAITALYNDEQSDRYRNAHNTLHRRNSQNANIPLFRTLLGGGFLEAGFDDRIANLESKILRENGFDFTSQDVTFLSAQLGSTDYVSVGARAVEHWLNGDVRRPLNWDDFQGISDYFSSLGAQNAAQSFQDIFNSRESQSGYFEALRHLIGAHQMITYMISPNEAYREKIAKDRSPSEDEVAPLSFKAEADCIGRVMGIDNIISEQTWVPVELVSKKAPKDQYRGGINDGSILRRHIIRASEGRDLVTSVIPPTKPYEGFLIAHEAFYGAAETFFMEHFSKNAPDSFPNLSEDQKTEYATKLFGAYASHKFFGPGTFQDQLYQHRLKYFKKDLVSARKWITAAYNHFSEAIASGEIDSMIGVNQGTMGKITQLVQSNLASTAPEIVEAAALYRLGIEGNRVNYKRLRRLSDRISGNYSIKIHRDREASMPEVPFIFTDILDSRKWEYHKLSGEKLGELRRDYNSGPVRIIPGSRINSFLDSNDISDARKLYNPAEFILPKPIFQV